MTTNLVFVPNAIVMPGGTTVTSLKNLRPSHNFEDLVEYASGDVGPDFTGSHSAAPDCVFDTPQLKEILDLCNVSPTVNMSVCADLSSGNTDVEYRRATNRGVRSALADLANLRVRMQSNAFLSWQKFTAKQKQLAEITARLVPVYDGTNAPLVATSSVAITASGSVPTLFTLGPVSINGSAVAGVTETNWDNQIEYLVEMADGVSWPDFVSIQRIAPKITIRSRNTALLSTYGTAGTALTALTVYLRKKLKSDFTVAAGTPQHLAFTAASGTIKAREIADDDANVEIEIQLAKSSGVWFSINTAIAIT